MGRLASKASGIPRACFYGVSRGTDGTIWTIPTYWRCAVDGLLIRVDAAPAAFNSATALATCRTDLPTRSMDNTSSHRIFAVRHPSLSISSKCQKLDDAEIMANRKGASHDQKADAALKFALAIRPRAWPYQRRRSERCPGCGLQRRRNCRDRSASRSEHFDKLRE
jgi:hypothetical protein